MSAHYFIGIDLGTTNIAVAYKAQDGRDETKILKIPQLIAPGVVAELSLLPAMRYYAPEAEKAPELYQLPWGVSSVVIGELAKEMSLSLKNGVVHSAKSWMAHPMLDITQDCLPIGGLDAVQKVSVIQVVQEFLSYIESAWNIQFPKALFKEQSIVVTIPASFDEQARHYTLQAISKAGLKNVKLLEEPQAAFYHWLDNHKEMGDVRSDEPESSLALVCDVGGGTTDFSLISLNIDQDGPSFERIAVGQHLLLGGDNMDLALFYLLLKKFPETLSYEAQSVWLPQVRQAKETLLSDKNLPEISLTLLGKGRSILKTKKTIILTREDIQKGILQAFFPLVELKQYAKKEQLGIRRIGLPYEPNVAITEHLASFLVKHIGKKGSVGVPDVVLFNGGVFYSETLQMRVLENLQQWTSKEITCLTIDSPSLAVAKGAVYYQWAKHHAEMQIQSSVPVSYFIELEGASAPLCILPAGTKVNQSLHLPQKFTLRINQQVKFPFGYSHHHEETQAGIFCEKNIDKITVLPALNLTIERQLAAKEIEVTLQVSMTEIGVVEILAVEKNGVTHQLELSASQMDAGAELYKKVENQGIRNSRSELCDTGLLQKALKAFFIEKKITHYMLRKKLFDLLGDEGEWCIENARILFDQLWALKAKRRMNQEAEHLWLNLMGLSIRPGIGEGCDAERIAQLEKLYQEGVQYQNIEANHIQWWVLWRRCVLGLSSIFQQKLFQATKSVIMSRKDQLSQKSQMAYIEKMRFLGTLEKIAMTDRVQLGNLVSSKLYRAPHDKLLWWMMARIGNREGFSEVMDIIPIPVVEKWLEKLLKIEIPKSALEISLQAYCLMAKKCNSKTLNINDQLYNQVAVRFPKSSKLLGILQGKVPLSNDMMHFVLGEALPLGLSLK